MNILITPYKVYKVVQGAIKRHFQLENVTLGCIVSLVRKHVSMCVCLCVFNIFTSRNINIFKVDSVEEYVKLFLKCP